MEPSAAGLLSEVHGYTLRTLGKVIVGDFDGLTTMARAAWKQKQISPKLKKKLEHLDIAVAFNRHAHEGKVRGLKDWLHAELTGSLASSGSDVDSDGVRSDVIDVGGPPPAPRPAPVSRPRLAQRGPPGALSSPTMPPIPPVGFARKPA